MEDKNIPEGFKKSSLGIIPKEWTVSNLDAVTKVPITYGIVQCGPHVPDGIPYIRVSDMEGRELQTDFMLRTSEDIAKSFKRSRVECGDLVYALRGKLGEVRLVTKGVEGANLTQGTARISPNDEVISEYLLWALSSENSLAQAFKEAKGSTFVEITLEKLKGVIVPVPTLKEQTAIANALSDVDALIAELEKLIAKKQAIKAATMQQLLTGRTRLPEFANHPDGTPKGYKQTELGEIPEDWECSWIGSVLKITTGSKNTQDKVSEGKYPFFVRSQNVERINSYSFDGEGVLTAGDGVGTGRIFHYINGKCDIHQRVYLMHDFAECLDGYYFYVFFAKHFYDRIMSMTAKSSVDSVRREMISEMPIILPPKAEQSKLANILSDMDEEIQSLQQRLDKTRKIKQGMMQELLTGKTRLI